MYAIVCTSIKLLEIRKISVKTTHFGSTMLQTHCVCTIAMTEWWIYLSVDLLFDLNVSSTLAKTISFPVLCIGDAGHSNNDSSLYPRCNMVMNAKIKSSLYVSMSPIVSWKRLIQSSDYAEEALCCHIDPIFCLPTCPSRFLWISKHQQHPQIFLPAMSELGVLQPEVANRKKQ